jgi:hypothetical protein
VLSAQVNIGHVSAPVKKTEQDFGSPFLAKSLESPRSRAVATVSAIIRDDLATE